MVEISPQSATHDADACGTIVATVAVVDNGLHDPRADPNKYLEEQDGLKHTFKNLD